MVSTKKSGQTQWGIHGNRLGMGKKNTPVMVKTGPISDTLICGMEPSSVWLCSGFGA
jgi:hypothetical protein